MDDTESSKSGEDTLADPLALAETAPGQIDESNDVELQALRANARAALFGPSSATPVEIGRYQIQRKLGEGGMGAVFLARDPELDRDIALKLLRSSSTVSEAAHARMVREAKSMARLSHPNVAHVYEVGRFEDQTYVAMEYIKGRTLRQWHKEAERSPEEIVAMHIRAAKGLQAAHDAGLVHRDYKPENVLVGDDDRPRVLDFGLARVADRPVETLEAITASEPERDEVSLTLTGSILGTPAYMAPEQFDGKATDSRTDQFAACVMLYEALFGERPFHAKTLESLAVAVRRGELPVEETELSSTLRDLRKVTGRGLSTDPEDRYASVSELIDALEAAVRSEAAQPRSRALWILAGLAALIGGAEIYGLSSGDGSPPPPPVVTAKAEDNPWAEILEASNLPEPLPTPLPDDPYGVTIHRLDNGLTIYVAPRSDEPRIHARVLVRAGASYEPPGQEGVAHLVEHVLFKGTPTLGTTNWEAERPLLQKRDVLTAELAATTDADARNQILAKIDEVITQAAEFQVATEYFTLMEQLGATGVDGYTGFESISTEADIPSNRLEAWAELEADRLRNPAFRLFFPGFSTVASEFQSDIGTSAIFFAIERAAFENTGRRANEARGLPEVIARPPLAEARTFHRERFCPNNIGIVLVGDIDPTRAVATVEKFFGDWEPKATTPAPPLPGPLPPGRINKELPGASPLNMAIAWRRPATTMEDVTSMRDLAQVVSSLSRERAATAQGRALFIVWANETLFGAVATTAGNEETDAAYESLLGVLRSIAEGNIPPELLERLRNEADTNVSFLARDRKWTSANIGNAFERREPWSQTVAATLARSFDAARISAAAKQLLEQGHVVVTLSGQPSVAPDLDLPTIEVEPRTEGSSPRARAILEAPATRPDPQVLIAGRHFTQKESDGVWTVAAPTDDRLFELLLHFPVDTRKEPMAQLAARTWAGVFESSPPWNRRGISVLVEGSVLLRISGPAKYARQLIDAIPDWHANGTIDEALLDRAKSDRITGAQLIAGDSASALLKDYALLGSQSWWLSEPTMVDIRRVGFDELDRIRRKLASIRPHIAYAGPNATEFDLQLGGEPAPAFDRPRAITIDAPRVLFVDQPKGGRAKVGLLRVGNEPVAPVFQDLLSAYVGDMPGVLYYELREKRGLAHRIDVHSWAPVPDARPRFQALVDVTADSVPTTLDLIASTLSQPVDPDRFERTRSAVEEKYRAHRVRPFEVAEWILGQRIDGVDADPRFDNWGRLPSVTLEEFDAFYRSINDRPATWMVVGDAGEIDVDALSRLGKVERLEPSDLQR